MYITDSNQYAIELVTYLLVLVEYFYEFIIYMLLERNAFDSIAFFSQSKYTKNIQILILRVDMIPVYYYYIELKISLSLIYHSKNRMIWNIF